MNLQFKGNNFLKSFYELFTMKFILCCKIWKCVCEMDVCQIIRVFS